MSRTLSGAFPVLPTPFRDDGQIDAADFLSVIDFVLESGVDGVVYPGVASEVDTLTPEERRSQVVVLAERIGGRIPIIIGASDPDPQIAARHVAQGAAVGAAAAMVIAPLGLGNDIPAQIAYFRAVATGAEIPIMLQNQPRPIGAGLTPEETAAVANAVPEIRYIKEETAPCGQHLTRIKAAAGETVEAIFGGAGGRYITDELARGAAGTMPAAELADIHAQMMHAWRAGDVATTRRLYYASLPLLNFQAVFRMHMTKEVLRRRGVIANTFVRGKGPKFDDGDRAELALLLADADLPYSNHRPS
ncbi:dihydrodipicolinate synthase family protein [Arsenicitalea aurantiaca]|uniref:Dihydrodipicolinate synthase family protein n=1 Tax=Arsenicitalea aurantiaca TaxID=1783274 RepID=A0A433X2F6_9HYPH|nr:dihydrodipicolinate synthase family protein [Arsenicitalea aurantiaca]RUT28273.1 dihydrodipicolinate synthase family protein [Arsenicitalea aurantiaca]